MLLQQRQPQLVAVELLRRCQIVLVEHTSKGAGKHIRFIHIAAAAAAVALQQMHQIAVGVPQRYLLCILRENLDGGHFFPNALHTQGQVNALPQKLTSSLQWGEGELSNLQPSGTHVKAVALLIGNDGPVVVGLKAQYLTVEKDTTVIILQVQDISEFVKCNIHTFNPFDCDFSALFRYMQGAEIGWG